MQTFLYLVGLPFICAGLTRIIVSVDNMRYEPDVSRNACTVLAGLVGFLLGLTCYALVPCWSASVADLYFVLFAVLLIIGLLPLMRNMGWPAVGALGLISFSILLITLTTWGAFHAKAYRNLIGEVKQGIFQTDVPLIDPTQVRVVDETIAHRRMEELMGTQPGLGSKVALGVAELQAINGKLYYVCPLEPNGFWSWKDNDGTPGYVIVSAISSMDAKIVLNRHLRYTLESWFGNNLTRHIRQSYPNLPITDYTFMIDPKEQPYWVVTTYTNTVGLSGADVTGALLVHAETGDMTFYPKGKVPSWAARIYPADLVEDQIELWGRYVHGWWNPSRNDVVMPTRGMSLVETRNGRTAWYVGIQSGGSDKGTTGFMLIDTIDKTTTFYHVGSGGVNENGAREALEGKVQQFRYKAGHPVMYNINGEPTYIAPIKDDHGNLKQVGICNVSNRTFLATGDTLADALADYQGILSTAGNHVALDAAVKHVSVQGKVTVFGSDIQNGRTRYLLMVDSVAQVAFRGTSTLAPEMPLTSVGDKVTFTYSARNDGVIDMQSFRNDTLNLRVAPVQAELNKTTSTTKEQIQDNRDAKNADIEFSKLSPQQKQQILNR